MNHPRWWKQSANIYVALQLALLGTVGCAHRLSVSAPATPTLPGSSGIDTTKSYTITQNYTTKNYSDDLTTYNSAVKASVSDPAQLEIAKGARNNIIWGQMAAIETVYTAYHTKLFSDKNGLAITSDAMTLGLTAASSIAAHAPTKTILSSLGTAFAGLGLSVDKNYFGQQSFQILGLAMQTRRDKVRAAIASNLYYCDARQYPLLQAQRDLIQYYGAGTLDSALQELQEEAGTATAAASSGIAAPVQPAPISNPAPACPNSSIQTAAAPIFDVPPGVYTGTQSVTISDATPAAIVYYTTDGTAPSTTSNRFTGPIPLTSTKTLEAIATAPGFNTSSVASGVYTIVPAAAASPSFSIPAGTYSATQHITLSDTTPGATIYYTTDGSAPTTASTRYSGSIAVASTQTIEGIATATGFSMSPVASAVYTIAAVPAITPAAAPAFSPPAGSYSTAQTISLSDATAGATIYYTIDGSTPTTASTQYSAPVAVSSTKTIEAIAAATGFSTSPVASAVYTILPPAAAAPIFSVAAGTYPTTQTVVISDATPAAAIFFTTDGTTPTATSTRYTGAISVSSSQTIEAIATATGFSTSPVSSAVYTISATAPVPSGQGNTTNPPVRNQPVLTPH